MSEIESDHVPQHDPPEGAELVQPEVDERHDSVLVEGDDVEHVLPPTELDPYTPETAITERASSALWVAIIVVIVVVAIVVVAALR